MVDRVDVESLENVRRCLLVGLQALAEIERVREDVSVFVDAAAEAGNNERAEHLQKLAPAHPTGRAGEAGYFADAVIFINGVVEDARETPVEAANG